MIYNENEILQYIEENDVKLDVDNNNDAQDFAMDVFGEDTVSVK